jgi:iron complex transport system permease protein
MKRLINHPAGFIAVIVLACMLLVAALIMGSAIGETSLPVDVVLKSIMNHLFRTGYPLAPLDDGIVWSYRLSRAVVAAAAGCGLAISGAIMQSLLRNPLADPYILGISAGSAAGAVSVSILGIGGGVFALSAGSFIGAVLAFMFVTLLAWKAGRGVNGIILSGIAGSQLFHAMTSLIITKSATAEQTRGIMFWLLGNLSGVRWPDARLAVPVAFTGLIVSLWQARALDAFTFGNHSAASLGVPVTKVYILLIGTTAMMTACIVSIVGSIGFVGLVIPHICRMFTGHKHRLLLPVTALLGAIFMVGVDVISRILISGQVLPVGVITALIGAPVFAFILTRQRIGK